MTSDHVIGVVGDPNCGKTTLFNALTGAKQRVGNWPGVTVERKTGQYGFSGTSFQVVDLPGTYFLDVTEEAVSLDEKIARDYVLTGEADLIVNILDASNLERNLYLTVQLAEMKVPLVVVLNMMDVAEERGVDIDVEGLSQRLGCPAVPVVASEGKGITALKKVILHAVKDRPVPSVDVTYAAPVERALEKLLPLLAEAGRRPTRSRPGGLRSSSSRATVRREGLRRAPPMRCCRPLKPSSPRNWVKTWTSPWPMGATEPSAC